MVNLESDSLPVIGQKELQHRGEVGRSVNMQGLRPGEHPHSGKKSAKPKNVVAVNVGNEDGVYLHRGDMALPEARLHPFAAVNQEKAPTH